MDEVARIDASAIETILSKAMEVRPKRIIFASRSSEWDDSRNSGLIQDFLGQKSVSVRLLPLNIEEQRLLFDNILPKENFNDFLVQVAAFDLEALLGNPLFLELFSAAYIQNNREFESKKGIFRDAILGLAKESNDGLPKNRPSINEIISLTEEIFTKLLLSGAVGISSIELTENQSFPYLYSMSTTERDKLKYILDTRLFKLADNPSQFEPVHRVVAEYCSANYLVSRIKDNQDQLTLRRSLSVMAPNGVVRDELRGLLGWMAALGDIDVETAAVAIDPYAVIANGDPSQLSAISKKRLLSALGDLASNDPFFRRSDEWRSFNVKDFFTQDIIEETKNILSTCSGTSQSHLLGLLLELLLGSSIVDNFETELDELLLNNNQSSHIRLLSHRNLVHIKSRDHKLPFNKLLNQKSEDSLIISSEMVEDLGVATFGKKLVQSLLQALANLYQLPDDTRKSRTTTIGSKYFITQLINSFSLADTKWFLDTITQDIKCTCDAKKDFQCHCKNGISKIVGRLLDRLFELDTKSLDATQVWRWTKKLQFNNHISSAQSYSVNTLQLEDRLRQTIQLLAFEPCNNREDILKQRRYFSSFSHGHSGLSLSQSDIKRLVDEAFVSDNVALWGCFYYSHNPYEKEKGTDRHRADMRLQASQKQAFMYEWAKQERSSKHYIKRDRISDSQSQRRRKTKQNKIRTQNRIDLEANRIAIESGRHWGWLKLFADYYLNDPEKLADHVDDPDLPEKALRNCISFIEASIPTLSDIAELECENKRFNVVIILHAACLAIFRDTGTIATLSKLVLQALKTDVNVSYTGVQNEERNAFESEVNHCLFKSDTDIEEFVRTYIEPQLGKEGAQYTKAEWLRYKPEFASLRSSLALEWLRKYPNMSLSDAGTLFNLCAEFGNPSELRELIEQRCREIFSIQSTIPERQKEKEFWFIRSFFFSKDSNDFVWEELRQNSKILLTFENIAGRFIHEEGKAWPKLKAEQIFKILDAFVEVWPKIELPSSYGSDDPDNERAYRFLTDIVWKIGDDEPNFSIPVLERLLSDKRFVTFHNSLKHIKFEVLRKNALRDFEAPSPMAIVEFFDKNRAASVEDLRMLMLEKLEDFQKWVRGVETDPLDTFYHNGKHVDENTVRNRIVDYLQPRMNPLNITIPVERHMALSKRCDFTAETSIEGKQNVLVIEVKGQWHPKLFTAATQQLYNLYSHHPDAALQGIYLVLWFGQEVSVAGKRIHNIITANDLKEQLRESLSSDLLGRIDICVLDLSR